MCFDTLSDEDASLRNEFPISQWCSNSPTEILSPQLDINDRRRERKTFWKCLKRLHHSSDPQKRRLIWIQIPSSIGVRMVFVWQFMWGHFDKSFEIRRNRLDDTAIGTQINDVWKHVFNIPQSSTTTHNSLARLRCSSYRHHPITRPKRKIDEQIKTF